MRSIWKGSIAFGLVNVPVKVYSATQDHDIKFHQVHAKDNGRIRYQRVCEVDGEVVEYRDIARAYESDDGQMVIITDDDIATLPEERSREIEVLEFVPASDVDPMLFDRSYFLEPDSKSSKSYVLLAKTLAETDRMAIVHFTLRNKTRLAALRVKDFGKRDVMVIHTLLWPDEIRDPDFRSSTRRLRSNPPSSKWRGRWLIRWPRSSTPTATTTTTRSSCTSWSKPNSKAERRLPPRSSPRSWMRPKTSPICWPSWRPA
ncbi:ku protein [Mycobacterium intracellulare MIN_061107_1834]|nr:ku protein [Mycobacterium intracellulare MIN_061107_1834]